MRRILYIILIVLLPFLGFSQAESNEALFSKSIENYGKGDYQQAIYGYQAILKSGYESSSLYYNMANAYYKLNHVPESIYYYEKALKLNPENKEARTNLVFANQMRVDAITPLPQTWLRKLSNRIISLFSLNVWATYSIIGVWLFVFSFLLYYFIEKTTLKRLFFTLMLFTVIFTAGTYFIANTHKNRVENEKFAILFDKTVRLFAEPNTYSTEVASLHEGTKVEIIEQQNDWLKVKLANGKIGWTKESVLKII